MTNWLYLALAFAGGAILPLQALINARLGGHVGGAVWAAAISFQAGALVLIALQLLLRAPWPSATVIAGVPAWAWVGGALGAFYVTVVVLVVPRVGAASLMASVIFGQVVASLLLDQFGVLAAAPHPASPLRIAGAGLLLVGVVLITRF